MQTITVTDRQGATLSQRQITAEGFMRVPAIVARTGIQEYHSSELGMDGNKMIRVYRPADEVFNPESLASYEDQSITNDHPAAMVDSKSYRNVVMGHIANAARREGDTVVADLVVKSQDAIDAIIRGKAEVSAGYTAEYDFTPGTTPEGLPYDGIQRNIRINHLALVDAGRAGVARILDHAPAGGRKMQHVTLDSGTQVEVADASTAKLIQNTIDGLRKQVADAEAGEAAVQEALTQAEAAKDIAEENLEQAEEKVKDLEEDLAEYQSSEAMDSARKIAGKDFVCDSKSQLEIKRAALKAVRPKIDWASKDASYIAYAWDAESEKAEDKDKDEEKESTDSQYRNLGAHVPTATADAQGQRDAARQAYLDRRYGAKK